MVDIGPRGLHDAAAARAAKTRLELLRLQEAVSQHLEDSALLRRRLADAWRALGVVLLPTLERGRLDRLSAELSVPSLAADPIFAALNDERAELDRTIREIESEQARRGDRAAIITRLGELEAAMAPHAANVEAFEREPTWPELFDLGYGTPRYNVPWWMFRHYRHRRQGAALVESLGPRFDASTVGELRERFLRERDARSQLAREWEECTVRKAGLDNLEHGLEVATESLRAIIKRHLSAARRLLCDQLRKTPPEALIDRVATCSAADEEATPEASPEASPKASPEASPKANPATRLAALRIAGLDAQHRHLSEVFHRWVEVPRKELVDLLNHDEGDVLELSGDDVERSMPFDEFADTYRDPQPAWDARYERYAELRRRLIDFDDYGEHQRGMSWWQQILGDEPAPADRPRPTT